MPLLSRTVYSPPFPVAIRYVLAVSRLQPRVLSRGECVDNGIQCVALRASVQPVGAAWAGGGAAGLATTVSTKNVPVVLFTSLTCATAAAGVAAITGRRK